MSEKAKPPKPPRVGTNPDDNPGPGRRSKFTADLALAICESVLDLNYPVEAARALGVGKETLRRWLALGRLYPNGDYGAFRVLLTTAQRAAETAAVSELRRASKSDPKVLMWLLERRHTRRWGLVKVRKTDWQRRLEQAERAVEAEREARERLLEQEPMDRPDGPPAS